MKHYSLLLFFGLLCGTLSAQVKISGRLTDSKGEPLEMANLLLLQASDSAMLNFGFTDNTGRFEIETAKGKPILLRMSYLGLQTRDSILEVGESDIELGSIQLLPQSTLLQEATVVHEMPISISGDTIIYQAEAFTTGQERKLEDVLKQLPGFEVDENGEVKVQGKTVEKVMVEGQDFFDGDTKLATKNIPANAVDKVQVLQDYNDVNPMRGLQNEDRIALNIKLKEGKKNIFFGDVSLEGGLETRYGSHANLFYYSPKASYNFIGDANNYGQPSLSRRDIFRFSGGFRSLNQRSGSNLQIAGDGLAAAAIQNDRAQEIESELAAFNWNYRPSEAWNISGFALYSGNTTQSSSLTQRSYLNPSLPEDTLNEALTTAMLDQNRSLMGKLSFAYAPSQALHVDYDGLFKYSSLSNSSNRTSEFANNQNNLDEMEDQRPMETQQSLRAFYEFNAKNISSLEANLLYKFQDPRFFLSSDQLPFPNLGLIDTNTYDLLQNRAIYTLKLDANLNHYFILDKLNHINFSAGTSISRQDYQSALFQSFGPEEQNQLDPNRFANDLRFVLEDYFVGLRYKTKLGKLTLSPGINAHQYRFDLSTIGPSEEPLFESGFLLPEFFARYEFKKSSSLTFNYAMQAQFTDANNLAPGIILNGYNSLFAGNTEIKNALAHNFSLNFFEFNMFNFTNIFAGINYNRSIDALVTATDFLGLQRVLNPINAEGTNDILSVYGSFEKRFTKWRVRLSSNLSYSNTNTLIQDIPNVNSNLGQVYDLSFRTNFKEWPNLEVGYRYVQNDYSGANVENTFVNQRPYASLDATLFKHLNASVDYAFNNYRRNGESVNNFDFLSSELSYRRGNSHWEFTARGLNLLNTGILREDNFSDNLISTTQYFVMPRYVLLGVKYHL